VLRNSKYKGSADYRMVLQMANGAKGKDDKGYRSEFIRLVETAQLLNRNTAEQK
jgi:Ca-activated chloride channel family protein